MKKIVIFASGSGSNTENIIRYFESAPAARVIAVFSNNAKAGVVMRAEQLRVSTTVFDKEALFNGTVLQKLDVLQPDLIVLAGFLLLLPGTIISRYPNKIINVHPSLLLQYGGKGMYGIKVHQAVLDNMEKKTGITIHFVNEQYDEGTIIFQASVNIEGCDTPEAIAQKVHELEHQHFPKVIEKLILRTKG